MTRQFKGVALRDIAVPVSRTTPVMPGRSYRTIGVKWWGEGAYERETIDGSRTAAKTLSVVRKDDLIINKIWVRNGSTAVATEAVDGCAASGEFPCFELDRDRVVPGWIHWLTKTRGFWAQCDVLSRGTSGKNRIKPDLFLTICVPLPPLEEQRRIVMRIQQIAAKAIEAQALRDGALSEAKAWSKSARQLLLVNASERYESLTLEQVSARISKGESPSWQGYSYQDSGPLFVRSENVLWGELDTRNTVRIPESFHRKLSRSALLPRDVLVNLVGASIGRACCVPPDLGEANVNQAVGVITVNRDRLLPEFLLGWLLGPDAQDVLHGGKVETARANISLRDLRELRVPLPPLTVQFECVTQLRRSQTAFNALHALQSDNKAELNALLPSILDRAFKGEL